jgi:ribosomal protein S27AE
MSTITGTCKKCGSGELIINDGKGTYTCKKCGYVGNIKEDWKEYKEAPYKEKNVRW